MNSQFMKYLPIVNFFIGSSALIFQTTILFPWHIELDNDFKALEREHKEKLLEYHLLKVSRLDDIDRKVSVILDHLMKDNRYSHDDRNNVADSNNP
jgi:hypothetical protein